MMEKARKEEFVDAQADLLLTTLINAIFDRANFIQTMVPLSEGIALLEAIASKPEHKVYIYSNAPQEWIDMYHDVFPDIFNIIPKEHIFSSGQTGHIKPSIESYQTIADHAGVPLKSLILIDDTPHYIAGAHNIDTPQNITFTTSNFVNVLSTLENKGILSPKQKNMLETDTAIRTTMSFGERCLF